MSFLPVSPEELKMSGIKQPDFIIVTGDAYVDHPSFGHAIIGRLLERFGYSVAIIAQPDWRTTHDFMKFGRPRLAFLVNSGNVDSMVNHYSVFKHRRTKDAYSPGGKTGKRPDRAVIVYCNKIREAYNDAAIIIGGLEASLRRFAHYDYWDDKVRRSILLDSSADLLIYGMGEHQTIEIADALNSGISVKDITWIRGTSFRGTSSDAEDALLLPSFSEICDSKKKYADSFLTQYRNTDALTASRLAEHYGNGIYIIQNPPAEPLSEIELDDVYELPYEGRPHPLYDSEGSVPAINEVKFSIVSNRGCFGGCSFCALTYHQGRRVQKRSKGSIIREAQKLISRPDFKGYIHDVGGPTANFREPACEKQKTSGVCTNKDCLFPSPCHNLIVDHSEYTDILRTLRKLDGVKKVFIRSGIRFDYLMADSNDTFIRELCRYHVSGNLKIAPEHVSDNVLSKMHKPGKDVFVRFSEKYKKINEQLGLKQFLIPYFISSHPGSTLKDAVELAVFLKKQRFVPDQVQDFYPTPGTLSTCMYYTGIDPVSGKKVYVPKTLKEKQMQRALLHYNKPENKALVTEALTEAGRTDLIGYGGECLVLPDAKSKAGSADSGSFTPRNSKNKTKSNGVSAKSINNNTNRKDGTAYRSVQRNDGRDAEIRHERKGTGKNEKNKRH